MGGEISMGLNLEKGERLDLTKDRPGLKRIAVACGWDAKKAGFFGGGANVDCDLSAFILDANGKLVRDGVVYFGDRDYARGAIKHSGDNLTGAGDGDDETVWVDLKSLPSEVAKVMFAINIYDCRSRGQHFGLVKNAFIRVYDADNKTDELCRFNLTENFSGFTGLYPGSVYLNNGEWKFQALGEASNEAGITEMKRRF
jgi:tellurium resistance protein TerD